MGIIPVLGLNSHSGKIKTINMPSRKTVRTVERLALYGGLGLVAYAIFSKVRAVGNLIFVPGQVVSMGFQNSNPLMVFSVNVQNTSSTQLSLNSFAGSLYSQGTLIGNVYNFTPLVIPPNGMVTMYVNVQLMALGVVNQIIQAFTTKNFTEELTVQGYVNTVNVQVPVNFTLKVGNE